MLSFVRQQFSDAFHNITPGTHWVGWSWLISMRRQGVRLLHCNHATKSDTLWSNLSSPYVLYSSCTPSECYNNDLIRSQFYICHSNTIVVAYVKLRPDWIIRINVRLKTILTRLQWLLKRTSVCSFTKEVNLWLAKCPLVFNGRLANCWLISLVKEATGGKRLPKPMANVADSTLRH